MGIEVLDVGVHWWDGYGNPPQICFLVDSAPEFEPYEKRAVPDKPDWHIYWQETSDGFASFFAWGGRPDDGFGGWRRTVTLADGRTEDIAGGWSSNADAVHRNGFPLTTSISYRLDRLRDGRIGGGVGVHVTHDRLRAEIERHLPDCEVAPGYPNELTVKWRGQMSKEAFMKSEDVRREALRQEFGANTMGWYDRLTDEQRADLACRPYSALGPALVSALQDKAGQS